MVYNIDDAIAELKEIAIETPKKQKRPDDKLINEYEKLTGFKFPEDYRKFLKEAGDVFVGVLDPLILTEKRDSHGELYTTLLEARKIGLPHILLPICEDNGNYYCLDRDGSVRYWSHDDISNETWPNLATWVKEVWIEGN